jgi:nucleotide-binding universal stress UspA family protein
VNGIDDGSPETGSREGIVTYRYGIVVGVDGSEAGQHAMDWALREAARRAATGQPVLVRAVTAYEYLVGPMAAGPGLPDPAADAQRTVQAAVARVTDAADGLTVTGEALRGTAGEALSRAAVGADLLVIGSHGHSRMHAAVLGSVAESCVRAATCPVAVIPTRLAARQLA